MKELPGRAMRCENCNFSTAVIATALEGAAGAAGRTETSFQ